MPLKVNGEDASERHDFYLYGIKEMNIFIDTSAWIALENKKRYSF